VYEKKIVLDTEKGALLHIIVQYAIPPSQPPVIAYNIAQHIFPTTPFVFVAIKYWQYLVRAKPRAEQGNSSRNRPVELLHTVCVLCPLCIINYKPSTSPPLSQFPVRVSSCPLCIINYKPSVNVNLAVNGLN